LYQGAFSELDDDIGWTDFALRNYDAQIGRWVQQDPYDEFASPYLGLGDDPINNIDPSGGDLLPVKFIYRVSSTISEGSNAISTASKMVNTADHALNATSLLINVLNTGTNLLNTSITVSQVGSICRTPDGGSIKLPEGATNLTFNDNSGIAHFVKDDGSDEDLPDFKVYPGSLNGFDFGGNHYVAIHNYSDASFDKYGWDKHHLDFDEISYRSSLLIKCSGVKIRRPQVAEASVAANYVMEAPAPLQPKVAAAILTGAAALTLSTIYWEYTTFNFEMTYPSESFQSGYLYSEKTSDELITSRGKKSPSYNPNYGDKTLEDLEKLARQGDNIAKKMKKLAQEGKRLLDKLKQKHR